MHRRLLVAGLVILVAGCVSGPKNDECAPNASCAHPVLPPLAQILCDETKTPIVCNFEATLTPATRQANELSIAANPTNPLNIIATGKDYTPSEAGDCVWAGLYATLDGGKTWTNQNVPGSPWKKLADPTAPTNQDFSKFWCATDPVVTFSADGETAYWTVMPYQCDRFSGSKTGRGALPSGGFNDWFWTCSAMYVLVSHDGGLTWPEWKQVAFGPRLEHDKQWIATAPDGRALLCWDRDTNYQLTDADPVADQLTPGSSVVACSVSKDNGKSWSEPTNLNPDWAGFTPAVEFDKNGTAYAVVADAVAEPDGKVGGKIQLSTSKDGVRWSKPVKIGTYQLPPRGGEYGWPVIKGSNFRIVETPFIAVDRGDGPYGGSLYAAWFDHVAGNGDVRVAYSRDGGATWTQAPTPHDDDPSLAVDQFYPTISVGPEGTVDVSWWDRRADPEHHLFDVFYTYSKDGGQTWAPNLRISDVSSDEQYSHHQNGMVFLGDYRDQDSSSLGAHLVWVDTRHNQADVFTAIVKR